MAEKRLIDANALTENLQKERASIPNSAWLVGYNAGIEKAVDCTQFSKTVEAISVAHGHWLETDAYPHHVYCSKCFRTFVNNKNWLKSNGGSIDDAEYCPHCHAKMDEVSE